MNIIKKWIFHKLTIDDLVEYFISKGIILDFTFQEKQKLRYSAKNSRLYKIKKQE